jgi:hypothetical protein
MLNLALNAFLTICGLLFIAVSIWGKRFFNLSWRKPLLGRVIVALSGVLLLFWGIGSLLHQN